MRSRTARTIAGVCLTVAAALPTAGVAQASPAYTGATQHVRPAAAEPLVGPPCAVGDLCVFDGPNFTGHRVDYFQCGPPADVRAAGLTRVASYINNQTGDQVASFYAPAVNAPWVLQYTSTAVDADSDTTDRTTYGVQAC